MLLDILLPCPPCVPAPSVPFSIRRTAFRVPSLLSAPQASCASFVFMHLRIANFTTPFFSQPYKCRGCVRVCVATRLDAAPILAGEEERGIANFLEYNPEQAYLLPPTVREVLGEGHLCFFVHG